MKAVVFHEYGAPDVLRYEEVENPFPAAGQVRVRVAATTFNGVDGNIRAGFMQGPMPLTLPHIPGLDLAGTVDALGDDVHGIDIGDAVIGFLPFVTDGASAELVVVSADSLAPAPISIPLGDAAALPLVGLTAWQALFEHADLQAGQRVLIVGAGGAVGGYAVQLAKAAGAYVIATGSPRSAERLPTQGADEVVDHTSTDITSAVREPVDVLLNLASIDPAMFATLAGLVRDGGVIVSTTVWMPAPTDEKRNVRGIDLYVRSDVAQLTELVNRVDLGELTVDIAERVGLSELASVHARATDGSLAGKVVVTVDV